MESCNTGYISLITSYNAYSLTMLRGKEQEGIIFHITRAQADLSSFHTSLVHIDVFGTIRYVA